MPIDTSIKKVAFCIPTITKPYQVCLDSIRASVPVFDRLGVETVMVSEVGCPYISAARSKMLRKALDAGVDAIVFIDHDLSWDHEDLAKIALYQADYVVGTYRFKREPEEYMGQLFTAEDGKPMPAADGALLTFSAPAGFMKITPKAINTLIEKFPELCYGERHTPHFDLFNHGAHRHTWYGEDYACCRRWLETGGQIWTLPNLNITHWSGETPYPGNLHKYLMKQPGGINHQPTKENPNVDDLPSTP